ncbi:MAG: hypothetical protein AAFX46_12175 [Cyanobacteria bacterium J06636_27]
MINFIQKSSLTTTGVRVFRTPFFVLGIGEWVIGNGEKKMKRGRDKKLKLTLNWYTIAQLR